MRTPSFLSRSLFGSVTTTHKSSSLRAALACCVVGLLTACAAPPAPRGSEYKVGEKSVFGNEPGEQLLSESVNKTTAAKFADADQPLKLIHSVVPAMPGKALTQGIEGTVVAELLIDPTGKVASVKILQSPDEVLSKSVMHAMHQWKFSPLIVKGVATAVVAKQSYTFKLTQ